MDFGALLHVAKRNNEQVTKNSGSKYYSTKFSAPKKETKEKRLSDNIKKFLAKKEQEEREKARTDKQKRDELLALRDEKAKNKIKKMLKVIKSANKSVLDDAVDTENTAVTIQGPDQPDEDDYGYVSQESSAFYQKYMDRVKTLPEENKFAPSRPASKSDLLSTKDRVRAAIQREQEEVSSGKRTKPSTTSSTSSPSSSFPSSSSKSYESNSRSAESQSSSHRRKDLYDPQHEREMEERRRREEAQQKAKSRPPPPPPMDFHQLLKLAEKKQYEPVEVVVEQKKEPERLLTKKEKQELEEQERREQRKKEKLKGGLGAGSQAPVPNKMQPNGRIPKLNGASSSADSDRKASSKPSQSASKSGSDEGFKKPLIPAPHSKADSLKSRPEPKSNSSSSLKPKPQIQNGNTSARPAANSAKSSAKQSGSKSTCALTSASFSSSSKPEPKRPYNGPTRDFPPKDSSIAKKPPLQNGRSDARVTSAAREAPKGREFPPADIRRKPEPQRKPQAIKRRIYDDYDDDEYDSEMDDFIDDGPEEGANYSNYIKEIFGYDKSRYRDQDEDDAMESSYAQQMREELVSKKIGLMEDLEDMRKEEEEKRRKALMKKRKLK